MDYYRNVIQIFNSHLFSYLYLINFLFGKWFHAIAEVSLRPRVKCLLIISHSIPTKTYMIGKCTVHNVKALIAWKAATLWWRDLHAEWLWYTVDYVCSTDERLHQLNLMQALSHQSICLDMLHCHYNKAIIDIRLCPGIATPLSPYGPLQPNVTSSIKPEVHNVSQHR